MKRNKKTEHSNKEMENGGEGRGESAFHESLPLTHSLFAAFVSSLPISFSLLLFDRTPVKIFYNIFHAIYLL